ncbi:polymorphic toxin-type HINT domain-containing protein [Kutzneria sp. NPDC052558]|uniref:polymorphic toxin-type HINT domain-containing protein n=1 Tax=Kutzneria sp. NPDC052558 TaxID=3364121 RepID=UPI0037C73E37
MVVSASSGDFWGNVGDAAASAAKFVWDGFTGTLMDAYHCLHSVVTTLDVLIGHGRWQPNNGYGPEYENCGSTAIDIGLLGLGPELKIIKPFANSATLESLLKGTRGAVGPAVDGLLDSVINGIPGLKNLFGKAEDGLSSALCALFNSFTASTPVEMTDGSQKPISDVHVGEQVLATDPTTGQSADKPVTDVIVGQGLKHLVDVTIGDGGATASVTATENHPFWVDNLSKWVDAGQLAMGEKLRTDSGREVTVVALHRYDENTKVYNLTVDGAHTYYVSSGGLTVLVHNGPSPNSKDCGKPGVYAGRAYELRLMKELGSTDGFTSGGRQFDGRYTTNSKEM